MTPELFTTGSGDDAHTSGGAGSGESTVSPALRAVRERLTGLPPGDSTWLKDRLGGPRRWITRHRELIRAAAGDNGLPADMVAAIAWQEVGGKPYVLDDITVTLRDAARSSWVPVDPEDLPWRLAGDRDKTSFGPMAVQTRRAAEVLGYDPARLTEAQRTELTTALRDPAQAVFISAGYLRSLKAESRFADVPPEEMTPDQYRELAARYNGGPYWQVPAAQKYADEFAEHRQEAAEALR
ncbi:hypothetical protein [Streptomyces meridianus]|uniref:Uncharacterized protein n=1 Tax=Streptomyces meridianus TaxID=2938945 RepID=A0ABT0X9J7_9ACTN|nr:hypothetical protein [Streptomyces meridianus]MCM2579207.1 hypothetical protein [Streptomyces meridianus]